jgi:hypothetical protein
VDIWIIIRLPPLRLSFVVGEISVSDVTALGGLFLRLIAFLIGVDASEEAFPGLVLDSRNPVSWTKEQQETSSVQIPSRFVS